MSKEEVKQIKVYTGPRVSSQPVPLVPALQDFSCSECGEPIWIAATRDRAIISTMVVMCYECAAQTMLRYPDEEHLLLAGKMLDKKVGQA